jgi:hypothetical protein
MSKIEDSVCEDIQRRAALGFQKYGVTLERTDIDHRGWVNHAYEEALDLACYLKRLMMELEKPE